MKVYRGSNDGGRKIVTVDGQPLVGLYPSNPRRNVKFDWGTQPRSRGAVHLAEAILAVHTGSNIADSRASDFARQVLSTLPEEWEFPSEKVQNWLDKESRSGVSTLKGCWFPSALDQAAPSVGGFHLRDLPGFPSKQGQPDWLDSMRERINPDALEKQGFPRPKDVRLSRSSDSTGEEAFYVYLVFPDRTPEEALAWEKIEPMVSWVRNLIWTETGARLWPYVKVKRQKELAGGLA